MADIPPTPEDAHLMNKLSHKVSPRSTPSLLPVIGMEMGILEGSSRTNPDPLSTVGLRPSHCVQKLATGDTRPGGGGIFNRTKQLTN